MTTSQRLQAEVDDLEQRERTGNKLQILHQYFIYRIRTQLYSNPFKNTMECLFFKSLEKACSVVAIELESIASLIKKRTLSKLLSITDNECHPLHSTLNRQKSMLRGRLLSLSFSMGKLSKAFVAQAIQLFRSSLKWQGRIDYWA